MPLIVDNGQLPVGWKIKKLAEVCQIEKIQGIYTNLPYVGMENIESNTARFIGSIKPQSVKSSTFKFNSNHVLYGRLRPYLNKVLAPSFEGHCSTEVFPIKPSECLNKNFLLYWLLMDSTVKRINATCTGARMPRANMASVLEFNFPLPSLSEQKRIVAILDKAFEGIDRAIANAEKNLANSRELFESYLQNLDAEKEPLGNLVDIKTGKLDANAATEKGQYPFFTCSRDIYKIDRFAFDCEAILLAGNNAVGDFNVKHYKGKFNAYQRTYVITVNKENRILYRYLYFQILKSLKNFKLQSVGAGTKFLKIGMIQALQIALPTLEKQQEIIFMLDKLESETQRLETIYRKKIAALNELKQSILQKAFTGELTADTPKTIKEKIAA
ncbi:restriction endonuclease subunit S [Microcoleus sp. B7-D4]|uniref:restriction endonuclease subunit S n=1 Tax=Microcoleus sp. B7-D4 TaxID=2818696 RepID=UPI002FD120D4